MEAVNIIRRCVISFRIKILLLFRINIPVYALLCEPVDVML